MASFSMSPGSIIALESFLRSASVFLSCAISMTSVADVWLADFVSAPLQSFQCIATQLPLPLLDDRLLSLSLVNEARFRLHHLPLCFSVCLATVFMSLSRFILPFPDWPLLLGLARALPSAFAAFPASSFLFVCALFCVCSVCCCAGFPAAICEKWEHTDSNGRKN